MDTGLSALVETAESTVRVGADGYTAPR